MSWGYACTDRKEKISGAGKVLLGVSVDGGGAIGADAALIGEADREICRGASVSCIVVRWVTGELLLARFP